MTHILDTNICSAHMRRPVVWPIGSFNLDDRFGRTCSQPYTRDSQHDRLPEYPRSPAGGLAHALSQKTTHDRVLGDRPIEPREE